jgi:serine/threonine protein kinase
MFLVGNENKLEALVGNLSYASQGQISAFSMLASPSGRKYSLNDFIEHFVAISLQRWPSETKVAAREEAMTKKQDSKKWKKPNKTVMQVGFSPGALQELQVLKQLHGLIKSSHGHPKIYLPVGIALPFEQESRDIDTSTAGSRHSFDLKRIDEDIFSLTRTSLGTETETQKEFKRKDMVNNPHLLFQPTPFVLQRFVGKKKRREAVEDHQPLHPSIFTLWCFDLLSGVLHCHENGIIFRSFQLDQIVVDHSGVAKIGSMYT